MPDRSRGEHARRRALEAIAAMRANDWSLSKAAAAVGTTVRTVRNYLPTALAKRTDGRYRARPSDRYVRRMRMLTPRGQIVVSVRGSREATRLAEYWAAVDRFATTGDRTGLPAFAGRYLKTTRGPVPFVTDGRVLRRVGRAGEVAFEDLYEALR